MKEFGGYLELDDFEGEPFYKETVELISGRACFEYLIIKNKIHRIWIPKYACNSVYEPCRRRDISFRMYDIDENFRPILNDEFQKGDWIYVINYYGQIGNAELRQMHRTYNLMIVDNSQAFFQTPLTDVDTIYVCRKFFGVADGAYCITDRDDTITFEDDYVYNRMKFLLGRFEFEARFFYEDYKRNNEYFNGRGIKGMSRLSKNILKAIDYKEIYKRRTKNYETLFRRLKEFNLLKVEKIEGGFCYPLLIDQGDMIRKKLIDINIFIPTLWPDVLEREPKNSREYYYAKNILPLPIDQRYDTDDMEYICDKVVHEIKRL